jgi:hypothetical protein
VVFPVALFVLAAVMLALQVLTGLGARRRGVATSRAVLAGLFFPVTWTVWYGVDEMPYRRRRRVT